MGAKGGSSGSAAAATAAAEPPPVKRRKSNPPMIDDAIGGEARFVEVELMCGSCQRWIVKPAELDQLVASLDVWQCESCEGGRTRGGGKGKKEQPKNGAGADSGDELVDGAGGEGAAEEVDLFCGSWKLRRGRGGGGGGGGAPTHPPPPNPPQPVAVCRTPEDPNATYIGCDRCENWFHPGELKRVAASAVTADLPPPISRVRRNRGQPSDSAGSGVLVRVPIVQIAVGRKHGGVRFSCSGWRGRVRVRSAQPRGKFARYSCALFAKIPPLPPHRSAKQLCAA